MHIFFVNSSAPLWQQYSTRTRHDDEFNDEGGEVQSPGPAESEWEWIRKGRERKGGGMVIKTSFVLASDHDRHWENPNYISARIDGNWWEGKCERAQERLSSPSWVFNKGKYQILWSIANLNGELAAFRLSFSCNIPHLHNFCFQHWPTPISFSYRVHRKASYPMHADFLKWRTFWLWRGAKKTASQSFEHTRLGTAYQARGLLPDARSMWCNWQLRRCSSPAVLTSTSSASHIRVKPLGSHSCPQTRALQDTCVPDLTSIPKHVGCGLQTHPARQFASSEGNRSWRWRGRRSYVIWAGTTDKLDA